MGSSTYTERCVKRVGNPCSGCALFVLDLISVGMGFAEPAKTLSPDSGPGKRFVLCLQLSILFPSCPSSVGLEKRPVPNRLRRRRLQGRLLPVSRLITFDHAIRTSDVQTADMATATVVRSWKAMNRD